MTKLVKKINHDERNALIIKYHSQGYTQKSIAAEFGLTQASISIIIKKGLPNGH